MQNGRVSGGIDVDEVSYITMFDRFRRKLSYSLLLLIEVLTHHSGNVFE